MDCEYHYRLTRRAEKELDDILDYIGNKLDNAKAAAKLMEDIGHFVLEQACQQLARWRAMGLRTLCMAVNLSPSQLGQPTLAPWIADCLQRHALPADAQVYTDAASRVLALYRGRLERGDTDIDAQRLQKADAAERDLRLAALRAERAEIFALARRGRLADDVARRLVREIDLIEARYQQA